MNSNYFEKNKKKILNLYKEQKFLELIKLGVKLIKFNSNDAQLIYLLGLSSINLQKFLDAEKYFEKLISVKKTYQLYYIFGNIQKKLKKFKNSITSFQNAIKLNPNFSEAYNSLGNAKKSLDLRDEAEQFYRKAISLREDNIEALFNLTNILKEKKKYKDLILTYQQILKLDKENIKTIYNLGSAYLFLGDISKACEYFNKQLGTKFYSLQPTNLYGENDNFDLNSSHVIPALINKFHKAKVNNKKSVEIWGSGKATREFMHVDDLAEAIFFLSNKNLNHNVLNIGTGEEISIKNLAKKISKISNYNGRIKFNTKLPDGTPRRIVDSSKLKKMGWKPKIYLDEGLEKTYGYFVNQKA